LNDRYHLINTVDIKPNADGKELFEDLPGYSCYEINLDRSGTSTTQGQRVKTE